MSLKNSAFVFVKPHANTDATNQLVVADLKAAGVTILADGVLNGATIDEKKLIDQHYYSIASKATILKPTQLNVPNKPFEEQFGLSWEAALATGKVYNALDACKELGIDAVQMDKYWAAAKKNKKLVKLGGGFYCGLVEVPNKTPLYVFNGFFMEMRSKFTDPSVSLHYYVVEFDSAKLAWKDFRGQLLGPTDPATAPAGSLRGKINAQWESLGLKAAPNVGDNGVHASASPFEGLAERLNWVGAKLESDSFGAALLAAGFPADTITAWSVDPQVNVDASGKMGSVFDYLEDSDADVCLAKLKELAGFNGVKLTVPSKFGPIQNPKASPTVVTVAAGQSAYICTCGQSAKFPLCDGSHKAYNAANGTSIRPQVVKNETDSAVEKWVCSCGFSDSRPYCDGNHASLSEEQQKAIQSAASAFSKKQLGQKIRRWAMYGVIGAVSAYIVKKAVDTFGNKKK